MKLKDAIADLESFRVQVQVVGPESPAQDHVAREEDVVRLVRLAGEFGRALGRAARKQLERRAFTLARELQPGRPVYRMRGLVLPALGWTVDESGEPQTGFHGGSLLFPFELACHRMGVQARMGIIPDEEVRDWGRRWLESLEVLDEYLARRHCWGSLIIHYCAEGRCGTDSAGLLDHTRDVLRGQLPAAALAVIDAARSLTRWRQARRQARARATETNASPDFREVVWFGVRHGFSATQAACVKVLWEAWENGPPDVSEQRVLEEADYGGKRMVDLFKRHAAWGKMIVAGHSKGSRRLDNPRKPFRVQKGSVSTSRPR